MFDLSREGGQLDRLSQDADTLSEATKASPDLRELLSSPVVSRSEQAAAIAAVADKLGLSDTMKNTLALMASKRRLFVVPQMLTALEGMLADDRGEVTAQVRAAQPLDDDQRARLADALKASTGRDVKVDVTVDDSLIGGLVVRLGSRMIDTSIRAKLDALQNTMKEVR